MYYLGCDVHRRQCTFHHMDQDGSHGLQESVPTTPDSLIRFLDRLKDSAIITFEATGSYFWLSQLFQSHPMIAEVHIVDPRRSRKLAEELAVQAGYGRAKNDHIDAEMLAEIERKGLAPLIHAPTPEQLEQRTINRHRFLLIRLRTRMINLVHSYIAMHSHEKLSLNDLKKGSVGAKIFFNSLPKYLQMIIKELVDIIELHNQQIRQFEKELDKLLPKNHPIIQIITSAPGFGLVLARTVITEIIDIRYFKNHPKYLVSYSGLAPIEHNSDGKKGSIKLNRHCNYYLKYAFIEAAHAARNHPKYREKYQRDAKKLGKQIAKFNLARRLVKAIYWMLIHQQPFKH